MIQENHAYDYDLLVIGAGPGGTEVAREVGKHGKKVAIIEANSIGGTCVNRGCIPAKTMLYTASMYRHTKKINDYGLDVNVTSLCLDFNAMIQKRATIMDKLRKGLTYQIKKDNVEIIEGYATMIDPNTIELKTGEQYTADQIVLATGGHARKFPGFDNENPRYLTSDNIFALEHMPSSMVIVGAGPVGTEFASFFNTFGTKVTVVEMQDTFLGTFDKHLGDELIKSFNREGIECRAGVKVDNIESKENGLSITLSNGEIIESEYILSSIGVQVESEYVKNIGVEIDQAGRVVVNDTFQTSIPNIHALGDLIGKSGSAYGAEREAKFIAYKLLGLDTSYAPVDYRNMPDVVFTFPEIGSCGWNEKNLQEKGIAYDVKHVQFMVNGKAHVKQDTRGAIWMYVEKETEKILGVHIIGNDATEIIHQIPPVLLNNMTVKEYLKCVWGHPVMAEIVKDCMQLG